MRTASDNGIAKDWRAKTRGIVINEPELVLLRLKKRFDALDSLHPRSDIRAR
jgi:hypothetical protein